MEKYTLYVGTEYVGSTVKKTITNRDLGFDDDLWADMTCDEKEAEIQAYFEEWVWTVVEAGWLGDIN